MPPSWTFLTNHARVLLLLAEDVDLRARELAERIGITERAAQRIVADLEQAGYLSHERIGRRNRYTVHADRPLRHPMHQDSEVARLLELFADDDG